MKNILFFLCTFLFVGCSNIFGNKDCKDDCTPREFFTPFFQNPLNKTRKDLGFNLSNAKEKLKDINIISNKQMDSFYEDAVDAENYVRLKNGGFVVITPESEKGMVYAISYNFIKCKKIEHDDVDVIKKITSIMLERKNINYDNLLNFNFNKSDDIKTKQIKLEKGVILEASCDLIDGQGQFHIYRE